jgi:hypothetical protein
VTIATFPLSSIFRLPNFFDKILIPFDELYYFAH